MYNRRKKPLVEQFCKLYSKLDTPDFSGDAYSSELMEAFFHLAEGSLHHKKYTELIEFGSMKANIDADYLVYGLKIKGKDILIASVLNILETLPIPQEVQDRFPDINQEEWLATLRIATLTLSALSPYKKK